MDPLNPQILHLQDLLQQAEQQLGNHLEARQQRVSDEDQWVQGEDDNFKVDFSPWHSHTHISQETMEHLLTARMCNCQALTTCHRSCFDTLQSACSCS